MEDEHRRSKGERGGSQPLPKLRKAAAAARGEFTKEKEGEEEMDIEAMVAETPLSGMKPLESPYGYNCYKVDIGDERYDTKQDPPNKF